MILLSNLAIFSRTKIFGESQFLRQRNGVEMSGFAEWYEMKKERNIGQEILAGMREIKEWQQGKKKLKTTRVQLPRAADVAKIRQNLDLTQDEFAHFMGVKVKTLQNWEQKRREPQGPATGSDVIFIALLCSGQ